MIEWWIDIPNLQTVHLPGSFRHVQSKSITSIIMNMNEWIDVSPILDDLVQISNRYEEIDELDEEAELEDELYAEIQAELQANQTEQTEQTEQAEQTNQTAQAELLPKILPLQANQNEQADEIDEAELEAMLRGL